MSGKGFHSDSWLIGKKKEAATEDRTGKAGEWILPSMQNIPLRLQYFLVRQPLAGVNVEQNQMTVRTNQNPAGKN
jgi:hypothetical protein